MALSSVNLDGLRRGAWDRGLFRWVLVAAFAAAGPLAGAATADAGFEKGMKEFKAGDLVAAMATLRPSASAGHAPSQALLGYLLDYSDYSADALAMYRAAAEQGNVDGMVGVAKLYTEGRGVAKDEKRAFEYLAKAAALGHESSIRSVAQAYLSGTMGQSPDARDDAAARAAIRRAAEMGHLPAVEGLARAYQTGAFGLSVDAAQEKLWQDRAAALRVKAGLPPKAKR